MLSKKKKTCLAAEEGGDVRLQAPSLHLIQALEVIGRMWSGCAGPGGGATAWKGGGVLLR